MKTQTVEICNDCKYFNYAGNMCLERNKELKKYNWNYSFCEFEIPKWCKLPDAKEVKNNLT